MAKKLTRREQQEQMRNILQGDHSHAGRPRRQVRYSDAPPVQQPSLFDEEPAQPPQPVYEVPPPAARHRQAARQFEQPVQHAQKAPRAAAQRQQVAVRQKGRGSAGGWILMAVLVVLLVAAGTLLFLVLTGRFSFSDLGGGGKIENPAAVTAGQPILQETRDAGKKYVEETLFIGDSNTVRLGQFKLVDAGRLAAQQSVGIEAVNESAFLMVGGQPDPLTAAQAAGVMQPTRILVMLGTNNIGNLSTSEFSQKYEAALDALLAYAPDADIIVAGIPPVAAQTSYPHLTPEVIKEYNDSLIYTCTVRGIPFLDTGDALAEGGYLKPEYADADGVHLSEAGLEAFLKYYRTHAWSSQ